MLLHASKQSVRTADLSPLVLIRLQPPGGGVSAGLSTAAGQPPCRNTWPLGSLQPCTLHCCSDGSSSPSSCSAVAASAPPAAAAVLKRLAIASASAPPSSQLLWCSCLTSGSVYLLQDCDKAVSARSTNQSHGAGFYVDVLRCACVAACAYCHMVSQRTDRLELSVARTLRTWQQALPP